MLKPFRVLNQPVNQIRLGDYLKSSLSDRRWTHFIAAIAFVRISGVRHIKDSLREFSQRANVDLCVGIDMNGTSVEGLTNLLECISGSNNIWVFHNQNSSTFHPKLYLFKNEHEAEVIIGSGNLTEGGLYTNYELSAVYSLDLNVIENKSKLVEIESIFKTWANPKNGTAVLLTNEFLNQLAENGYIFNERTIQIVQRRSNQSIQRQKLSNAKIFFSSISVPSAPELKQTPPPIVEITDGLKNSKLSLIEKSIEREEDKCFLMTLQRTDVGVGQTTAGTSRRSPEIFVPLSARDYHPSFWGWPDCFSEDPRKVGKMDRRNVKMRLGSSIIEVNMMTWPVKHDFRLRNENLRSSGNIGDIMRIEKTNGKCGYEYLIEIISQETELFKVFLPMCNYKVKNSMKLWGYY